MLHIAGYTITQTLYESANSLVYRALRNQDMLPVILKMLKEDYPSAEELTRYRQEYDTTCRLADVEGVVLAHNLVKHQNTLVMDLEDFGGESLRKWLDKRHTFTVDELLTLPSGGQ